MSLRWSSFFQPQRVAIVGASRDPAKVGHRLVLNAKQKTGLHVVPVNPGASEIAGLRCVPSLREIHEPIDIVVVAVPAAKVRSIVDECLQLKPAWVVMVTAGFAEDGVEGAQLQAEVAQRLSSAGIGLLGPNTMGYAYTPQSLNLSFGPSFVPAGSVGILSQSGALISAAFEAFRSVGEGVSLAVSMGNKAGVSEEMLLEQLITDEKTKVVLVYLESIANPEVFFAACAKAVRKKPVFVLLGGTTQEGRKASASHTAALATAEALVASAQRQAGFVLVSTLEELLQAGIAVAKTTTLPSSVMVLTNAGGPAVVMVDQLSKNKVPLQILTPALQRALADIFPTHHIANPMDMLGDATARDMVRATSIVLQDPQVDAVILVVTKQAVTDIPELVELLVPPPRKKTLIVSLPAGDEMAQARRTLRQKGILSVEYPNQAASILSALVRAYRFQVHPPTQYSLRVDTPTFSFPENYEQLSEILHKSGLQIASQRIIHMEEELTLLKELSFPLIAKTTMLDLKHKANVGAVIPQLSNEVECRAAYKQLAAWKAPVVYQEYVTGLEVIVGCVRHAQYGWYLAVGLGGSLTNLLEDRAYVFLPATRTQVQEALLETKAGKVVSPSVLPHLVDTLVKIAGLAGAIENVDEVEFNPLFVSEKGCIIADMKRGRLV